MLSGQRSNVGTHFARLYCLCQIPLPGRYEHSDIAYGSIRDGEHMDKLSDH
jgi:hypothetical protein